MRLFSEEVKITSSNSLRNILQVKDFQEVFFGVFEVQINENKYVAEKISEENGNPIISVVVEDGDTTAQYPFLLLKGKQEIYFNSKSEPVEIFESSINIEEDEEVDQIVEQSFDNIEIIEDKKQEIIEEIKRVKRDAIKKSQEILEQSELEKIQNIKNESNKKEKALTKYLESARENLVNEFTIISEKIKSELISDSDDKLDEIRGSVDLKIQDIADNLNESLKKNFQNSSKLIDKSVKQLVKELYESNINPKVDNELKNIAEEIVDKVSEIDRNLNNKLNEKANVSLIEGVNKELDSIRDANIELNNSINKGVQKALSRVGNIDKKIVEISEKFDRKISDTEQEIAQYFNDKLSLIKEETLDITDEARNYFRNLIEENKNNLLSEIRKIKDEKPVEYILESKKGEPIVKDWDSIEKDWNKKIHDKFENYKTDLRKYVAVYASGGGTNATQYQDGGTMNGDLTIVGKLSAGEYLGISIPSGDYLPLSGGTITGEISATSDITTSGNINARGLTLTTTPLAVSSGGTGLSSLGTGIPTFLQTPTSSNLAAAVTDETGSGSLVFGTSPTLTSPVINTSLTLNATTYTYGVSARDALRLSQGVANSWVNKDGLIPLVQLFEDFPSGINGAVDTIGTLGWRVSRTTGGSNAQYSPPSNSAEQLSWGIQSCTTAATSAANSGMFFGPFNGQRTHPLGCSMQICFAVPTGSTSQSNVGISFVGGGGFFSTVLDFANSKFYFSYLNAVNATINTDLVTGLTLSAGNFVSGKRYRIYMRLITTTTTEFYLSSADWNSSVWTTLYDAIVTHAVPSYRSSQGTPSFSITTNDAVAKTMLIDWAAVGFELQR